MDLTHPEDLAWMTNDDPERSTAGDADGDDSGVDDPAPAGHNPTFGAAAADANASLTPNDKVDTPDGRGVILDVHEGEFTFKGEQYEPGDGKLFIVATEDGSDVYSRDEISASRWTTGVDDPASDISQDTVNVAAGSASRTTMADVLSFLTGESPDIGWTSYPPTWQKADVPARLILLDAWASMEASFTGCMEEIDNREICASMKDEVYGWERWR